MELSPERLARRMAEQGIRRAWIVHDPDQRVHRASHPLFEEIAAALVADPAVSLRSPARAAAAIT